MSLFIFNYTKKNFFLEEEKHDARRKTVPGSIQQNRKSKKSTKPTSRRAKFKFFRRFHINKQHSNKQRKKHIEKWNFQTRSNMEFGCYGLELVLYVLYIVTHANTRLSRAKRIYDRRRLDTSWDTIGFFHNHVD